MIETALQLFAKGIVLAILYFEITKANDTTLSNIIYFAGFYSVMFAGASLAGIDPNVVTTAFVTKTVFTLVDERVKKKENFTNLKKGSS